MEWPFFDANSVYLEPETKVVVKDIKRRKLDHAFQSCRAAEKIFNNKKRPDLDITLEEKLGDETIGRHTRQIWVKGLPWWIESIHKRKNKEWCTAKLIMVNDVEKNSIN